MGTRRQTWPKECRCGARISLYEWPDLPFVIVIDDVTGESTTGYVELRLCKCRSYVSADLDEALLAELEATGHVLSD